MHIPPCRSASSGSGFVALTPHSPNNALKRTPGSGAQLRRADLNPPGSVTPRAPSATPGTGRAFTLTRSVDFTAPGPASLSFGALGVATLYGTGRS